MAGARSLTQDEHLKVKESFDTLRNKCLYLLGKNTGFRISELLSITIEQVLNKDYVKVMRRNTKGKIESREVILNKEAKEAILNYISSLPSVNSNAPLFVSRNGGGLKQLSRFMGAKILKDAFHLAGLQGTTTSHSMRKSYALNIYNKSGHDLLLVQRALGHSNINTTIRYLPVDQDKLNSIILDE